MNNQPQSDGIYVSVRIIDAAESYDRDYTYLIPKEFRGKIKRGTVCAVPYGSSNKIRQAIAVGFPETEEYKQIKPVSEIMDYPVTPNDEMLELCGFVSRHCFCTFGSVVRAVMPAGQGMKNETFYEALNAAEINPKAKLVYETVLEGGKTSESKLSEMFGDEVRILLNSLVKLGVLKAETSSTEKVNEKVTAVYSLANTDKALSVAENPGMLHSAKQRTIVSFLKDGGVITATEAEEMFGIGKQVLTNLVKDGIIDKNIRRDERMYIDDGDFETTPPPALSEEQKKAFSEIETLMDSGEPKAGLLFGVTGSGKTRVIIEACRKAVESGRSAIVLVPEIGLTAQAVTVFRRVFGKKLFVIHSMLSSGERLDTARRLQEEDACVVIGTRSAVFAKVNRLGLICIDEEQEHTYKSENTPKYHARDIARFRCNYNKCLMLLASATPSVESFYKAKTGVYSLIKLESRFGNAVLPECSIIDIRGDRRIANGKMITEELEEHIKRVTSEGNQAILFVNRRGYNTHLSCASCGYVFTCPNCSVSMTYHAYGAQNHKNKLICHYCGYVLKKPEKCPDCGSEHIGFSGSGTQKLQEELESDFPSLRALRMDADTTGEKHSHDEIIASFGAHEYDILFGTQMIAKGLDFPYVGLVGVVSADSSLYMNDFRAGERTFSLFTQLAGRSGRSGKKGEAYFQSANPENEILRLSLTQDYERFYESEISLRKAVLFPPFCNIAVFTFSAEVESDANNAAEAMSGLLGKIHAQKYGDTVKLIKLGPYREGIFRLRNKYRQHIIIKYKDNAVMRRYFGECYSAMVKALPATVKVDIDTDPPII